MEKLKKFYEIMSQDAGYLIIILAFVVALFVIAIVSEKIVNRKNPEKVPTAKKVALIGIFAAASGVLMCLEIQLPFIPPMYGLDFSEVPVMISGFMLGPVAGVITEFIKVLVKLLFKPSSTAYIGEFANFIVGCTFVIPATVIYKIKKSKKMATIGLISGTVVMIIAGCFVNAFVLLPAFARYFGNMPMSAIIGMGTKVNAKITDLQTFVMLGVLPMNLIKGVAITVIVTLVYKKISKLIKTRL